MLTEWTISNFKSFSGSTTIPLAPITILAGANSSGKSSIIQSILLIKQTLQYAPHSRPVGLNGPLLKLGRFDDIRNAKSKIGDISIGWVLDELESYRFSPGGIRGPHLYYPVESESPFRAKMALSFASSVEENLESRPSSPAELSQLQPTLTELSLKVDIQTEMMRSANISLAKKKAFKPTDNGFIEKYSMAFPYFVTDIDNESRSEITDRKPNGTIIGANIRHFFPFRFGYTYLQRRYFSQKILEFLVTPNLRARYMEPEISDHVLSAATVNYLIDLATTFPTPGVNELPLTFAPRGGTEFGPHPRDIGESLGRLRDTEMTARDFLRRFEEAVRYSSRARQSVRNLLVERQEEIEECLYNDASALSERGFDSGSAYDITYATESMQNFFQSNIHYLGPLRDEPRPIYPLEALINPKDVGYRGEHTAAVLDLHRETRVECFKSSDASMLIGAERVNVPLLTAVQDWLSYLGVAESVTTTDLGKIGHQLQVSVDKEAKAHDLTNVGVGVSQLLPLVVMSLLASSPCLLIFEQPELHLHPKVQARLADFFFSLGLLGKQCLLETHSEYLVERFRLRIAQAPGEALNEKVRIFFTQKIDDETVCREVKLTKYGAIIDWPDDFFDQAENETEAILRAAQAKRRSEGDGLRDGVKK